MTNNLLLCEEVHILPKWEELPRHIQGKHILGKRFLVQFLTVQQLHIQSYFQQRFSKYVEREWQVHWINILVFVLYLNLGFILNLKCFFKTLISEHKGPVFLRVGRSHTFSRPCSRQKSDAVARTFKHVSGGDCRVENFVTKFNKKLKTKHCRID